MVFNTGAALLDAIVLAVVSREDEGTYGYKITQDVRKAIDVSESTLYPVLRRLQKGDYLEVYDRQFDGRNRRYYKVTESGRTQLAMYQKEWKEYSGKISELFEGGRLDRIDALKYYNDYFDDAGSENEQNVIEELESPEKVAMKIKADREDIEDGKEGGTEKTTEEAIGKVTGENAAYSGAREQHDRENTYQYYQEDTYGEEKDNKIYQDNGTYDYESQEKKPWTNKWLKLAMIIAIVVIGFPIVIPLGAGILALIAGIVIAVFCLFAAIVIGFAAVVMVGVVLFVAGIGSLFANPGVGLAVLGAGLMVIAIGVIGTVVGVRLCIIVFPGIVRGIVYILRKPFHRKAVA